MGSLVDTNNHWLVIILNICIRDLTFGKICRIEKAYCQPALFTKCVFSWSCLWKIGIFSKQKRVCWVYLYTDELWYSYLLSFVLCLAQPWQENRIVHSPCVRDMLMVVHLLLYFCYLKYNSVLFFCIPPLICLCNMEQLKFIILRSSTYWKARALQATEHRMLGLHTLMGH